MRSGVAQRSPIFATGVNGPGNVASSYCGLISTITQSDARYVVDQGPLHIQPMHCCDTAYDDKRHAMLGLEPL